MNSDRFTRRGALDAGLFIMRLGIGLSFISLHGLPKLMGGPHLWGMIGHSVNHLGIYFLPVVWGLAAALSEFVGGVLLISGFFTRIAAFFMICVMIVAATSAASGNGGIAAASHPLEVGFFLLGIIIAGPGRISLDYFRSRRIVASEEDPTASSAQI